MESTEYAEPSPACDLLRAHLREIWKPIDWETVNPESVDLTTDFKQMPSPEEILFTARSLAMELNVPLSQVLRVVHRGLVRPMAKTTAGGWLFSKQQVSSIKSLIETK